MTDAEGRPVSMAWVTVTGTDSASWQLWATTSDVTQADERGRFSITMPAGEYRVHALPAARFGHRSAAWEGMSRIGSHRAAVRLKEREERIVPLTLQAR